MSRVLVVGLGYVGLPLAVRAAEAGHSVIGVDTDVAKVASLNGGHSPVEDVSDIRLLGVLARGSFRSARARENRGARYVALDFDVGVVAVPTPLRDGEPDLRALEAATTLVGQHLLPGRLVVIESTTYPGTTERLMGAILEKESGLRVGTDFWLGYSPERIDPGNRVHTLVNTPKVISATTPEGLRAVRTFYDSIVDTTVSVSSPATAEFTKVFENVFSQVNIALVNELATVAHEIGVNIWEVIDAATTKPHGFLRHTPGPGVGGHCLPVDPAYLSWLVRTELGRGLRLSDTAQEINDAMPAYVAERAAGLLEPTGLAGARVLVLGVAYKKGTGDLRETPARPLVAALRAGGAAVDVSDPHVTDWESWIRSTGTGVIDGEEVVPGIDQYDLAIVCTDHDEFDYRKISRQARRVLDCRNRIAPGPRVCAL
ncbi:MAG: nucleotide sugar dehydrogenase [Nocardioides sp.]|nr:nucleotide sugar dehydrogenase [Nocardioides sp.]